ncbi:hypothetical protein D3870_18500 [Noviherbaspirillum cavernae]|uniref:Uncharacterized protein n=1 Tax=Noviherbaspirillum cavernae TaxID=2320862 RepID=A0A418X5L6_9BURK|nr:hypothetical protein [Noviherbaspirillum cavernae]RJG07719.1 hypothetical protein D3870_18500 [Noviherbaspirillum cavernae]
MTDFSAFKPFGRYKFEVYRSASDKKAEFYTRSIAAPIAASYGPSLHWPELGDSAKAYLDPANAKAAVLVSATIDWSRGALAPHVDNVLMTGRSSAALINVTTSAFKQSATSATINANIVGTSTGASCASAFVPALSTAGNYREIALRGLNASGIRQYASWSRTNN